jgi:hypothetical protein
LSLLVAHDLSAERVARNDSVFRDANERISGAAREYGVEGLLPFLCECAEPRCSQIVRLTGVEYEAVRASGIRFLNACGHEDRAQDTRVVERHERYEVHEKTGRAAEIAEELDPRT